jgi:uncharacterized membrane protein (DUF4010 family)
MNPEVIGLSVALGAGLLIGLERERRKGQGAGRRAAGIRSFTLAALGGALAQVLDQPALVALGGLVILLLAGLAYWRGPADDPGLTTELALFVTYLIGVLSVQQPPLGAGAAAVVAVLLAARQRLHRFATRALSEAELHDALLLAALLLVVLPLMPAGPLTWLAGLEPRRLLLVGVLILLLQAGGHIAGRLVGARAGLALAGLFSGFVSSTATVASMGARARARPADAAACAAGAMLSTAATWLQALAMTAAVAPGLAARLAPVALAGAAIAAATGAWQARQGQGAPSATRAAAAGHGPLRVREAALVAFLLSAVALGVGLAQQHFGTAGVLAGTALGALADAHAAVATLATLQAAGRIGPGLALGGVLLAVAVNSVSRTVVAVVAGGAPYAARVAGSLLLSGAAAAGVALVGPLS